MAYHYQTKIQREEAYVNSHAASVDRTINSREFRLGTLSYVETGHIPHDRFWSSLAKQEEHDPSKFFAKNPQYAGFFTAPAKLGELPQNNVIFDVMKDRDINQHATFAAHHPFYVGLVDRDLRLEAASPTLAANAATSPTLTPILPLTSSDLLAGPSDLLASPSDFLVGPPSLPAILTGPAVGTPIVDLPPGHVIPAVERPPVSPSGPDLNGAVPEPASILMLAVGLITALGARRFFRHG